MDLIENWWSDPFGITGLVLSWDGKESKLPYSKLIASETIMHFVCDEMLHSLCFGANKLISLTSRCDLIATMNVLCSLSIYVPLKLPKWHQRVLCLKLSVCQSAFLFFVVPIIRVDVELFQHE